MRSEPDQRRRKSQAQRDDSAGRPGTLDREEERKATEQQKLDATVTYEVIRREAVRELNRAPSSLGWSGVAAGLAMGLSLLGMATIHHGLPESSWRSLVTALGYSIGFLVVTLGSQELFTENTLRPIVPLMATPTRAMLGKVAKVWVVVLAANLLGAMLFGWAAARTAVVPPELHDAMGALASEAVSRQWLAVFATGVIAGWVIALMVWMLPAASTAQVVIVIVMAWVVGAAKLSHVIVGSVEAFYLVALGQLGMGAALGGYVLPALLGNTLGGVVLVAMLNHAQVK